MKKEGVQFQWNRKVGARWLVFGFVLATSVAALLATDDVPNTVSGQTGSGCRVTYRVVNQWPGNFQGEMVVTNLGAPVTSWTLEFTFPTTAQRVTQLWNGVVTQTTANVTVRNAPYNGSLGTNGSASPGFLGTWSGSNPSPGSFRLNGVVCGATPTPTPTATPTPTPTPRPSPTPTPTPTATPTPTPTATPTPTPTATPTPTPTPNPSPTPVSEYSQRFLTHYNKIKTQGYFRSDIGVPYHSIETLIVEAPDQGHETTSEAFSYWIWLEAMYGRITGNWQPLADSWAKMEQYIIPTQLDQPTNAGYNAGSPATYAAEFDLPSQYPSPLMTGSLVGADPIAGELRSAYGTSNIYGMHWLLDVDNWYGYGRRGDKVSVPSYINTFQRGPQESVWETVPQPSFETFGGSTPTWGRINPAEGFLSLFTIDASYARQWRYTNAPDADARAIQAIYWAKVWADERGGSPIVNGLVAKAAQMGDYLRYSMFDKYFKRIGNCINVSNCPNGSGKNSMHLLLSWYYAWGGAAEAGQNWAWRIGSSHNHFGYQNPLAAYVLSQVPAFRPRSATGATDWANSLQRQMEFYRWLQSTEGGIAGGATNSWQGSYAQPPAGRSTFYGMFYDDQPVFVDPPSNRWFGFQAWSMERVAEYYFVTGNANAKTILDKWVMWARSNTTLLGDGTYQIPSDLGWSGQPDTWNPASPGANAGLHVTVLNFTNDVGVTAAYAKTLMYYAARSGDVASRTLAKELIDRMWARFQDPRGITTPETRTDYSRFRDSVFIPSGWTGVTGNGAPINASSTFLSLRPRYMQDPDWPRVQSYLNGGPAPTFTYHRFWAQADIALAMAEYGRLFP